MKAARAPGARVVASAHEELHPALRRRHRGAARGRSSRGRASGGETRQRHPQERPGIGDRLFPTLGNGGYDARHYTLSLRYPTADRVQTVVGVLTMEAKATRALSRFNLDFDGVSVAAASPSTAAPPGFSRDGEELVDHAAQVAGGTASASRRRCSTPRALTSTRPDFDNFPLGILPFGWFSTQDGSVTAGQPDRAHEIYPVNDHTADKATYSFVVDVPAGTTAAANGVLKSPAAPARRPHGVGAYEMRQPMASQVVQVAVGQLDIIDQGHLQGRRPDRRGGQRDRRRSRRAGRPLAYARAHAVT